MFYIKAVFSEENYVSHNRNRSQQACLLLFIVSQCSIISRESMHKHNFGQTLKLQSAVGTVNIRSRSLKSNSLFSASKQITCIYASLVQKKNWFRRQSSEKAEFAVFHDDGLEMR